MMAITYKTQWKVHNIITILWNGIIIIMGISSYLSHKRFKKLKLDIYKQTGYTINQLARARNAKLKDSIINKINIIRQNYLTDLEDNKYYLSLIDEDINLIDIMKNSARAAKYNSIVNEEILRQMKREQKQKYQRRQLENITGTAKSIVSFAQTLYIYKNVILLLFGITIINHFTSKYLGFTIPSTIFNIAKMTKTTVEQAAKITSTVGKTVYNFVSNVSENIIGTNTQQLIEETSKVLEHRIVVRPPGNTTSKVHLLAEQAYNTLKNFTRWFR